MHSHSSSTYKSYCWTAHDVWQVFPAEKCCLHYTCVPYTCSGSFKPFLPFSDKTKVPQNDIKQNIILTWISQLDSLHDWNFVNVWISSFFTNDKRKKKSEKGRDRQICKTKKQRERKKVSYKGGLASGRLDQSQIQSVPGSLHSCSSLLGLWGLFGL